MAFTLDKILFSPILEPISITHTVGFGSSLSKTYSIQNTDANEVKLNIKAPTGVSVNPSYVQLAPNQSQNVVITADRTFFDNLPKGSNSFNVSFEFVGQGDPIDPTSDVIIYELQLTSTPSLTLKVNQTAAITAQVMEKNLTQQTQNVAMNKVITYQSSNPGIVTVGQISGTATGISPGNAQITVNSEGAGTKLVLVGVFADPPAPRWWEKVIVNTTTSQRFYAGPYKTPIDPYPTRETRNGQLYDVWYVKVEEDRMGTKTEYYDWVDVTNSVQQLTDTEKLAKGYISSSTKPAAPSPVTYDTGVVRVVTNAKYEERIMLVIITVSQTPKPTPPPSPTPFAPPVTPSPSPNKVIQYCLKSGQEISRTLQADGSQYVCVWQTDPTGQAADGCVPVCYYIDPFPSPTPSRRPVIPSPTPTPMVSPPPIITSLLGRTTPDAPSPQAACDTYLSARAYQFVNSERRFYDSYPGTPTNGGGRWIALKVNGQGTANTYQIDSGGYVMSSGGQCSPPPSPTPIPSPPPAQTVTLSPGIGGTINGRATPFSVTVPFGQGISVNCVPATGYDFSYAESYNAQGISTGRMTQPSFMVYANGNLDEVRAFFTPQPTGGGTGGGDGGGTRPPLY